MDQKLLDHHRRVLGAQNYAGQLLPEGNDGLDVRLAAGVDVVQIRAGVHGVAQFLSRKNS